MPNIQIKTHGKKTFFTLPYLWCSTRLYQTKENKVFQKLFQQTISEIKNLNHTLEFHRKVAQPLNSVNYLEKIKTYKR